MSGGRLYEKWPPHDIHFLHPSIQKLFVGHVESQFLWKPFCILGQCLTQLLARKIAFRPQVFAKVFFIVFVSFPGHKKTKDQDIANIEWMLMLVWLHVFARVCLILIIIITTTSRQ